VRRDPWDTAPRRLTDKVFQWFRYTMQRRIDKCLEKGRKTGDYRGLQELFDRQDRKR
jgi:hypothetical protein